MVGFSGTPYRAAISAVIEAARSRQTDDQDLEALQNDVVSLPLRSCRLLSINCLREC
jgi:hypothetical protein